jgi:hypothetical protein
MEYRMVCESSLVYRSMPNPRRRSPLTAITASSSNDTRVKACCAKTANCDQNAKGSKWDIIIAQIAFGSMEINLCRADSTPSHFSSDSLTRDRRRIISGLSRLSISVKHSSALMKESQSGIGPFADNISCRNAALPAICRLRSSATRNLLLELIH